ncbi:acyl-CoA synthetase [Arsenicicoccus sp. oral taxon 190]|uniref:acyl-CoA synthetase n=1 Tax=Arsenicicoccus sp. oral taxon 190 TaxID=1658671 RepID=UPI000679EBAD|nr:long-chain fatty acid--CoA ligase [Arsenicicoccus sp. oral taxon 190]AKT50975.1 AMP-dependent synthetase [Arsenicicoccus sp. oral taxon 190]
MRDAGMGSWPRRRARMTPDHVAFVHRGVSTTYGQVQERADRLAHGLRALGVERGDRVAYLGLNSVELVLTMFATAKLGAVTVPLNTRLAPPETAFVLQDSAPRVLVWDEGFEHVLGSDDVAGLGLQTVSVAGADGHRPFAELLADGSAEVLDEPVSLDDLFMIQYTSGTSGRPKGVMMTHANISWNVYNVLVDLDLTSTERSLVSAPLFHTAALNQLMFPTFLKGGTSYLESSWDAGRALELIETQGITWLFGVTTMLLSLLRHPQWATRDLSSLRIVQSGGAPLPEPLLRAYLDRGLMIIQGYGLTESSPGATMLRAHEGATRIGSAGTPCFFSDVRAVTPELQDAATGTPGEVLVQGPNVSPGYWHREDATAEAFLDEGWLRTGDLGTRDEDGYLRIVDRLKDMIISGGENIYPAEVEQAIYTHPAVAEVAVIGVPDPHWGEVGRAVVSLRPGETASEAELLAHLDGRLARYKIPKSVVIIDELPHNASGKLVKNRVKEQWGHHD